MKSVNLEQAYARLWAAVENGTVDKEFSDLREEARHYQSLADDNLVMQEAGFILLETHQEWDEVGPLLDGVENGDQLFDCYTRVANRLST